MLGFLNLRNTPNDWNLGSPAQRLMSRRTQTLKILKKLFAPKVILCNQVSQSIRKKRQQNVYYDKSAKTLRTLKENQAVRIQTTKRYDKLGVMKQIAKKPRSYIVESDGKVYRRNRRHLLAVPERIVKEEQEDELVPFDIYQDPVSIETTPTSGILYENSGCSNCTVSTGGDFTTEHTQSSTGKKPQKSGGSRCHPIVTTSGRISKPNSKYQDYVS